MSIVKKAQQIAEARRQEELAKRERVNKQEQEDKRALQAIREFNMTLIVEFDGYATADYGRLNARRVSPNQFEIVTDQERTVATTVCEVKNFGVLSYRQLPGQLHTAARDADVARVLPIER